MRRKEPFWGNGLFSVRVPLHGLSETKIEEESWLSGSLWRELIRDCFLAELLSAEAVNNCFSGSRSCSSGLHHFWEDGQGPQPQYKDCLKHMRPVLSEAALLFLPVLFTGLLKQTCSESLSLDWLFTGLLSPSCFRLTWLMQFLFLKSLLELFLKHFLSVFSEWPDQSHGPCAFCRSYREEAVGVTHAETILHPIKKTRGNYKPFLACSI